MAYLPLINVVPQFFDNLGDPLVGGTLNAYVAGTSTPTNMYSDISGTVAGTSVTLDSRGEPTTIKMIWLDTSISYKFILKDANSTTIWTEDNISVTGVADGSITSAKLANDAVTTAKIANSAVTTAKIADGAVTPSKLQNSGYELGSRNKIMNGSMIIAQRGTSFASLTGANSYTLDRWYYGGSGSGVVTVSQNSDVPSSASEFQYSLRIAVTTADTSIGTGDFSAIRQLIEGFQVRDLIGRTFTLSFWVRSTKTGTHCVSFRNGGSNRSWVSEYTINAADTWEFKSVTVTGGLITAGSWYWTSDVGLQVTWALANSSANQTSMTSSWQTGNYISTGNQVNCLDSTSNIFAITGVQLEAGSSYTPFEHRHYALELTLAQRYYETQDYYPMRTTTTGIEAVTNNHVRKRAQPTFTATPNQGSGITIFGNLDGYQQSAVNTLSGTATCIINSELTLVGI